MWSPSPAPIGPSIVNMVAFNVTGCWTASSATKGVDQMAPGSRFGDKVDDLVRGATACFCLTRALS